MAGRCRGPWRSEVGQRSYPRPAHGPQGEGRTLEGPRSGPDCLYRANTRFEGVTWGFAGRSSGRVVPVDHTSEGLATADRAVERYDGVRVVVRWALVSSLVGSVVVEVAGVLVEHGGGVAFAVEEDSVSA